MTKEKEHSVRYAPRDQRYNVHDPKGKPVAYFDTRDEAEEHINSLKAVKPKGKK